MIPLPEHGDASSITQGRIKAAFARWVERLGLAWWRVDVRYYDDPGEIVRRFHGNDERPAAACVVADWRYAETTIDINLPAWTIMTDEEIERAAVHELVHVLVNEMHEGELHHEERVVTQITKAIFWTVAAVEREIVDDH